MRSMTMVFALLATASASADGLLFVPIAAEGMTLGFHEAFAVGGVALETDQRAVILFRDGRETLVLQAAYAGPSAGLAWIIPVPSAPKSEDVFLSSQDFIEAAFEETEPVRSRQMVRGKSGPQISPAVAGVLPLTYLVGLVTGATRSSPMGAGAGPGVGAGEGEWVTIHAVMELGPYRIAVLSATDATALGKWLTENGFATAEGLAEVARDYIARGWCFVAAAASAAENHGPPSATEQAGAGQESFAGAGPLDAAKPSLRYLPPLAISFATPEPVYPLRISRLGAPPVLCLRLVVLAPDPVRLKEAPGAKLQEADLPAIVEDMRIWRPRPQLSGVGAPAGSLEPKFFIDSVRRKFAEESNYSALICEGRASLEDFRRMQSPVYGVLSPVRWPPRDLSKMALGAGRQIDISNLYATRFWGLIRKDLLDDLFFTPGLPPRGLVYYPGRRLSTAPFVVREQANGYPAEVTMASHWFLAVAPLVVAWLVATWLLVRGHRWLGGIADGDPAQEPLTWSDAGATALTGIIVLTGLSVGVFAALLLVGAIASRLLLSGLAGDSILGPGLGATGLLVGALCSVPYLGLIAVPLVLGRRAAAGGKNLIGGLVFVLLLGLTWGAAVVAGAHFSEGVYHGGAAAVLCAGQLGMYSLLAGVIAAGLTLSRRPLTVWPLAAYLGLLAGTFVAGAEAKLIPPPPREANPAEEFQKGRQAILTAIAAFAHDTGALPRNLNDLTSTGPIRQGLDSSGNPVPLNVPGGRTPYLERLPIDPLSGRRSTWTYEPTGDLVVDSKAWRAATVEGLYIDFGRRSR